MEGRRRDEGMEGVDVDQYAPCTSLSFRPSPSSPSWAPILEHVNEQFDKYLNEELGITRKKVIPDTRVHCCLYFIPPTGHRSAQYPSLSSTITPSHTTLPPYHHTLTTLPSHALSSSLASLRQIDVEFMKGLHHCVNIIPVIAKADTLTIEERDAFKQRVGRG